MSKSLRFARQQPQENIKDLGCLQKDFVSVCETEFRSPQEVLIKFLKLQTWNSQSLTQMDVCVKLVLLLLHTNIFSFQMSQGEALGFEYGYL